MRSLSTGVFLLISASLLSPTSLWAASLHETWIHQGMPSTSEIQGWSKSARAHSFNLELTDVPTAADLNQLQSMGDLSHLMIVGHDYPTALAASAWKELAARGMSFAVISRPLPTGSEITVLNQIGFPHIIFILEAYPGEASAERLSKLGSPYLITMSSGNYPHYNETPPLALLKTQAPLLFVVRSWPHYVQMDVLNLLPQHKRLRVKDIELLDSDMDYLKHVRDLDEVTFETDTIITRPDYWSRFGKIPLQWTVSTHLPSSDEMKIFETGAAPGTRKLIVDTDEPITPADLQRLASGSTPVEWIHAAP